MNYFLVGYLVFEEKHYYDGMTEGRLANKWRYGAQMCQIGGLAAYAILWLGLTDDPFLQPVDTPRSYVFMLLRAKLSEEQWDNWIDLDVGYTYCIYVAVILAPSFLFFVFNFIYFLIMHIRQKKRDAPIKNGTDGIAYILLYFYLFFAGLSNR